MGALRELPSCETFHGFSVNPVDDYRVKGHSRFGPPIVAESGQPHIRNGELDGSFR